MSFYHKESGEIDVIVDEKAALEVKMSASRQDIANLRKTAVSIKLPEYYVIPGATAKTEK